MKIKLGVLGCGMIGLSFIEQVILHSSFELVSICSKTQLSISKALKLLPSIRVHLKKEDFFSDDEIEGVIVCTPHEQHAQDAILALKNNKHVLIEKPLSTNINDLDELLYQSIAKNELVVTALPHGDYEYLVKAKEIINSGVLGKITAFHSYLDVPGPPRSNWYYSKSAIGGASLDTLPYALNRLFSLIEQEPNLILGFKNQLIKHRICGDGNKIKPEVDDNATLVMELKSGQQAIIRSSWNTSVPQDFTIVHGRNGVMIIDAWKESITLKINSELQQIEGFQKDKDGDFKLFLDKKHPEKLKLDVFANHILKGTSNLNNVIYQTEIILALLSQNGIINVKNSLSNSCAIQQELLIGQDYI